MQNPNISSSSISDASQIRYQKAVRQISKLIGTNNAIKKDAQNFRIMCENLQIQNQQLFQGYQQAVRQRHQYQQKAAAFQGKIKQLQFANQNLSKKQQSLISQSMIQEERKKHQEEIQICHEKLNEQGHTIILLQQFVAQLQKENKDLKSNHQKLQMELHKEAQHKAKTTNQADCVKCPENTKKMHEATEWRQRIEQQNIELRKKLAFIQLPNFQNRQVSFKQGHYKDYLIGSLQQKIRNQNQQITRQKIRKSKESAKIRRLQDQLQTERREKQRTVQTSDLMNGESHKLQ